MEEGVFGEGTRGVLGEGSRTGLRVNADAPNGGSPAGQPTELEAAGPVNFRVMDEFEMLDQRGPDQEPRAPHRVGRELLGSAPTKAPVARNSRSKFQHQLCRTQQAMLPLVGAPPPVDSSISPTKPITGAKDTMRSLIAIISLESQRGLLGRGVSGRFFCLGYEEA